MSRGRFTHHSSLITHHYELNRYCRPRATAPELRRIALTERMHQLIIEVIELGRNYGRDSFFVHLAAAVDVVLQALVEVIAATTLGDLRFVVKLDLRNQEPGKAAGVVVCPHFGFIRPAWGGRARRRLSLA